MSSTTRRRWSAQDKLSILREARQTGQTVSEVCRRHGLSPGLFYVWEKQAQEGALQALRHERNTANRGREVAAARSGAAASESSHQRGTDGEPGAKWGGL